MKREGRDEERWREKKEREKDHVGVCVSFFSF